MVECLIEIVIFYMRVLIFITTNYILGVACACDSSLEIGTNYLVLKLSREILPYVVTCMLRHVSYF